eukprot:3891551-Prymnesium_polylepis.1
MTVETHLGLRSANCANMAARSAAFENVGPQTSWCVCNLARIRKLRAEAQRLPMHAASRISRWC